MQKAKKGNAVLAIGLTAALALGSAGLAGTAYADTPDQNNNDNARSYFMQECYNVLIFNDDTKESVTSYQIKVTWGDSIENAVEESLEGKIPEGMQFTGDMGWKIPVDFNGAKAWPQNGGTTITVHVKNTVVPVQNISLNVEDENGNYLDTVTVEYQENILDALTARFGDTYDSYTWLESDVEVHKYLVALQEYDGWTIVAHKTETPVVTTHKVSFEDCLSSTEDPIIVSVEDGELIDPSSIPSVPVCDGWTFEGWYTLDENGKFSTEKFDFDTPITADVDLYAK